MYLSDPRLILKPAPSPLVSSSSLWILSAAADAVRRGAQVQEVVDTFRVAVQMGAESLSAYVISMARHPSDVLAVELLKREAAYLVRPPPPSPVPSAACPPMFLLASRYLLRRPAPPQALCLWQVTSVGGDVRLNMR